MKSIKNIILLLTLQLFIFPFYLNAGVPLRINFQGNLQESGELVTGNRNFTFKIYDAPTGGNLIWTSQTESVMVTNGIFSVVLQTGTPVNLSTATFSGSRYIEVSVDGTTLSPRQEIVSSPYSLIAQSLASDAQVPWNNLINVPADFADGIDNTASSGSADNLGNHIATMTITANYGIAASTITASTGTYSGYVNAQRYLVNNSTMVAILPGTDSIAYGVYAGTSNASGGNYNVFVGNYAGTSNTDGDYNTFLGSYAGMSNTTGWDNTFLGNHAGQNNTEGWANTFLGNSAGWYNTTGNYNTFLGNYAGFSNTTGNYNTFLGSYAGQNNTEGGANTFLGHEAGYYNQTGYGNAIVGYRAGFGAGGSSFSSSTIMGYQAGYNITTGSDNLLLGFKAGDSLTTGSRNIIIGYDVDALSADTSNYLNIGGLIHGDLAAGKVGIGTTSPGAILHVSSQNATSTQDFVKVSTGTAAGSDVFVIKGSGNVGIGTTGPNAKLVVFGGEGTYAAPNFGSANRGAIHIRSTTSNRRNAITFSPAGTDSAQAGIYVHQDNVAGTHMYLATTNSYETGPQARMTILNTGNVGIGTTAPGAKLDVAGRIWQTGTGKSVFIGEGAGASDDLSDNYNVFVGYYAGQSNTTGGSNTFLGYSAGQSNTTGYSNTFVGRDAGYKNTTGVGNTFLGLSAGRNNTTGGRNTFLGTFAGTYNTTGVANTFVGYYAGHSNNGNSNTFLGYYAGWSNTTGDNNTFVGHDAGYYNRTGSGNTIVGHQAGGYGAGGVNSFSSSTIMGYQAGYNITTGSDNLLLGFQAGYNITTGSDNLLLGFQAGDSLTTGSGNIIIGYDVDAPSATTSNYLNIGGLIHGDLSAGNVGIGTMSPGAILHVSSPSATSTQDFVKVSTGTAAGSDVFVIKGDGNVGIGTTSPDEKFEVEWSDNVDAEIGRGTSDTDVTFLTLRSPNGTKYYITVTDGGTLSVSTTKP